MCLLNKDGIWVSLKEGASWKGYLAFVGANVTLLRRVLIPVSRLRRWAGWLVLVAFVVEIDPELMIAIEFVEIAPDSNWKTGVDSSWKNSVDSN